MKNFERIIQGQALAESNAGGFSYVGLIILLAILSITALGTVSLDAIIKQRQAEQELLRIGKEFRKALILYAVNSPAGASRLPNSLEDLCRDPRYRDTKRYLRQIYADPLTGTTQWGSVLAPDGKGIIGIYSLAEGKTLKVANFEQEFEHFARATTYSEWIFSAQL